MGNFVSVLIDYDQFLKLKKEAEETFERGDSLKAIDLANQALTFNPNGEWINYDKGLYQSNLGINEEAIESFTKEINLAYSPLSLARSHF